MRLFMLILLAILLMSGSEPHDDYENYNLIFDTEDYIVYHNKSVRQLQIDLCEEIYEADLKYNQDIDNYQKWEYKEKFEKELPKIK